MTSSGAAAQRGGYLAALSAGLSRGTKIAFPKDGLARQIAHGVTQGGVNLLRGGKFANGAVTAAFVHFFNAEEGKFLRDKSGQLRPGPGFVINKKHGYWQTGQGALIEHKYGSGADIEGYASTPKNFPGCGVTCTVLAMNEAERVTAIGIDGGSSVDILSESANMLSLHSNTAISNAGTVLKHYSGIGNFVYNAATHGPAIAQYCTALCNESSQDYFFRTQVND